MSIVEVLEKATRQDLEDLDEEIEAQTRRLDSLKAARRLLDVRLNGRGGKKKSAPAAANGEARRLSNAGPGARQPSLPQRMAKFLLHAGASKPAAICEAIGHPASSIHSVLARSDWFERAPDGVRLSAEGRKAAAEMP